MSDSVVCVSDHAEDLAPDGIVLSPGATATDVDLDNEHNRRLLKEGRIKQVEPREERKLEGKALDRRAEELQIEGRTTMTADEKRAAVAEAEENLSRGDGGDGENGGQQS
jgi:hypothetical protein